MPAAAAVLLLGCVLLLGTTPAPAAGQFLDTTCPLVPAAVCTGQCSNTAPSLVKSGTCSSERRRQLLGSHDDSQPARAANNRPPRTNPPRPDWQLQQDIADAPAAPPQRYFPYGNSATAAPESPEQQEQIRQHLEELMQSAPGNQTLPAAGGGTEVYQDATGSAGRGDAASSALGSSGCPAGTSLSAADGTCSSSADAFPAAAAQEAAVISTVTLPVVARQPAEGVTTITTTAHHSLNDGMLAPSGGRVYFNTGGSREAPIDPGSEGLLAVGPDGLPLTSTPAAVDSTGGVTAGDGGGSVTTTTRAVAAAAPYTGPTSQVSRTLTMIGNSKIKVGIDLERAGTISWVSSPLAPAPFNNSNVINNWDQGRLLQQSFYGCVDGSCWASRPWLWNPVQGGSWQNAPGLTTRKEVRSTGASPYVYAEGLGRNWGAQDLVRDLQFTTNVTLLDNVAVVNFVMNYTGSTTHSYLTQEVPAVFVDRKLSVLAYYDGASPWTGDKALKYAFPPGRNTYARPTEHWAAYIDPATGWGLGVYNPKAWMGITAYRIGPDGSASRPWDCSYFAHTIRMQLHPGMKPYPYSVYVTVGRLDAIRATFYKLRTQPAVLAATAATTAATRSTASGSSTPDVTNVGSSPLQPTAGMLAAALGGDTIGTDATNTDTLLLGPQPGQPDLGRNAWYGQPLQASLIGSVVGVGGAGAAAGAAASSAAATPPPATTAAASPAGQQQQGVRQNPDDGSTGGSAAAGSSAAGSGDELQGLSHGRVTGIIVGAVAACVLVAGAVFVRATQQRRRQAAAAAAAAASSSERVLPAGSGSSSGGQAACQRVERTASTPTRQRSSSAAKRPADGVQQQQQKQQEQEGEEVVGHEQLAVGEVDGAVRVTAAQAAGGDAPAGVTTRGAAKLSSK